MNYQIDARGKACPTPVIMAKKESDSGREQFSVLVDNQTAVENLKRFGSANGYETAVSDKGADFEIEFVKSQSLCEAAALQSNKSWAVFVSREGIGEGDPELGATLLKMFFYTLAQDRNIPQYILFMNNGVKVPANNEQVVEHLQTLKESGAEILVCGTCLNFYGLADQLKVGLVSNMYDIAGAMSTVDKVITL
jgi:selenium metabolism protein YedF